jgi:Fe(3+) dicitrate transport protein
VKNTSAHNKKSPWLPLALALAVNAAVPLAFAAEAIHIRAQPLGQALSELGQQTSLQVFFSPELVAGKQAPAVDGNLSPEQALRQLLQGSGLDYQINDGSVTLLRPQLPPAMARWSWA